MVVIVDENSGESATAILEDQLQVSGYYSFVLLYTADDMMLLVFLNTYMIDE